MRDELNYINKATNPEAAYLVYSIISGLNNETRYTFDDFLDKEHINENLTVIDNLDKINEYEKILQNFLKPVKINYNYHKQYINQISYIEFELNEDMLFDMVKPDTKELYLKKVKFTEEHITLYFISENTEITVTYDIINDELYSDLKFNKEENAIYICNLIFELKPETKYSYSEFLN